VRRISTEQWQCTQCAAVVRVVDGKVPIPMLVTSDHRRERVVMVAGIEVHRCRLDPGD